MMTRKVELPPSYQLAHRVDGWWVIDRDDPDRIPPRIAEMIARAMPQPGDYTIAAIRKRMLARHKRVLPND
jgi:hypothetical protein